MKRVFNTRFLRTAALFAPFVVSGVAGQTAHPVNAETDPTPQTRAIRVAPGRAVLSITPAGVWKFGARGGELLLESGRVIVYSTDAEGRLVERMSAGEQTTKSLLPAAGIPVVQEGARGGARYPSPRADDDNDGRVDEDPLDGVDNDGDGRVDEDFAATGDAMAVVKYGPAGNTALSIRQEVYGWSLAHIDRMAASALFLRNTGTVPLQGVRIGFQLAPGDAIASNRLLARSTLRTSGKFVTANVMIRGRDESLAALFFAHDVGGDAEWTVHDDGEKVMVVSPDLDLLAPGQEVVVYFALLAATSDDSETTRAVQAARRTVFGDGHARMIPPPVPVTSLVGEAAASRNAAEMPAGDGVPAIDAFWLTQGKLEETLLGGSPNPFRDAITIEYEVPTSTLDETGVEHTLSGVAVPTSVKVYNVTGRLVATLAESAHAPGRYRTGWTALTDEGDVVASGVYYVKLTIGKRSVTKRLVQLK